MYRNTCYLVLLLLSTFTFAATAEENPACDLLTDKEVALQLNGDVTIVKRHQESDVASCTWMLTELNAISGETPFQVIVEWDRVNHADDNMGGYTLSRAQERGEPIADLGDEAYWVTGALSALHVWQDQQSIMIQITGGQPQREASKVLAGQALRRMQ